MANLTKIGQAEARAIQQRVLELLAPLRAELGLSVSYTGGTLGANQQNAILKFEFATTGVNGVAVTRDADYFKRYALQYGFKAEDLGASFRQNTKTFTIKGYNPKAERYPITVTDQAGRSYKLTIQATLMGLGRTEAAGKYLASTAPLFGSRDDFGEGRDR